LYDESGNKKSAFAAVPDPLHLPVNLPPDPKATLFAFGGDRANSTPLTAMINILFLREHNRLCGLLERAHPDWDDERTFQTARNINIVQLIKIVVEEYINHISPYWFHLLGDPSPCYRARWNRANWIPLEFNLLYRWHSLVPDEIEWNGQKQPMPSLLFDHRLLLRDGLARGFDSASRTRASQLGLFNTAAFLQPVEAASIKQGRTNALATYNDYREAMRYPRVTRFEQINGDPRVVEGLRAVYGDVDKIEFFVGLFAEEVVARSAVPPLIGRMVAVDAFSHALTNPLLAPLVFNATTFSTEGMAVIETTRTLRDLLARNTAELSAESKVTMELDGQDIVA
jgi:prostaglandin-endoperoxide synthase 2